MEKADMNIESCYLITKNDVLWMGASEDRRKVCSSNPENAEWEQMPRHWAFKKEPF